MSRQILCLKCGEADPLHQADIAQGWTARKYFVSLHEPPHNHGYSIDGVFHKLDAIHCDLCNEKLNSEIVVAVSRIPPEKEMAPWEHEYGRVMNDEEVAAYRRLAK